MGAFDGELLFLMLGLPDRDERGPMCYDCQHVARPEECHTARLCKMNEVIGITISSCRQS